jgi:hypothetical protein
MTKPLVFLSTLLLAIMLVSNRTIRPGERGNFHEHRFGDPGAGAASARSA